MMVTKVNKGLGGWGLEKILSPFYYPKWGISDKERAKYLPNLMLDFYFSAMHEYCSDERT